MATAALLQGPAEVGSVVWADVSACWESRGYIDSSAPHLQAVASPVLGLPAEKRA